jgi:hypothetical protein
MSKTLKRLTALAFTALGFTVGGQAYAMAQVSTDAAAIDLITPGTGFSGNRTLGFSFSVHDDAFATALGVFDAGRNGLAGDAQVAIWNTAGDLLTSVTIPSGTDSSLDGYFRYARISNYRLVAGLTYIIGAYSTDSASSFMAGQGGSGGVDPKIFLIKSAFSSAKDFSFPSQSDVGGGAWLGGNLRIAPIPEPETYQMLALGLLVVTAVAGLRRRQQG